MNNRNLAAIVGLVALAGVGVVTSRSPERDEAVAVEAVIEGVDTKEAPTPKAMPMPERRKASADDVAYATAKDVSAACACATGPSCAWWRATPRGQREVVQAPQGVTLAPGTWRGADCLPKPCVERGAQSTWPKACAGGP